MQGEATTVSGDQSPLELRRELAEAREQQAATGLILRAIGQSPGDLHVIFGAIVSEAARLCEAEFSAVARFDGEQLHLAAVSKMAAKEAAAYQSIFPRPPRRDYVIGRAFIEGRAVHVHDIEADPEYDPKTLLILKSAAPYRTYLGIPIIHRGRPIGVIGCGRREVSA